jgi:hypothetical protein
MTYNIPVFPHPALLHNSPTQHSPHIKVPVALLTSSLSECGELSRDSNVF